MSAHPIYVAVIIGLPLALFAHLGVHLAHAWAMRELDRRWRTGTVPGWARWVLRVRDGVWSS